MQLDCLFVKIGGKLKTHAQIASLEYGYVVRDDVDFPNGNSITLWVTWCLY